MCPQCCSPLPSPLPQQPSATASFEAPGLLSGFLGVVFTGVLARRGLGISQSVPCVAARRLQALEAGAASVLVPNNTGDPADGSPQEPSRQQAAAASDSPPRTASAAKQPAGVRPTIELTAVAAGQPLLRDPQAADGCTQTAQGLLAVLAAMSPVKAADLSAYPRPDSAPPMLDGQSATEELEGEEGGSDELLPARAIRSHFDMTAHSAGGAQGAAREMSEAGSGSTGSGWRPQRQRRPGSGSLLSSGSCDNGDAAYLTDRRQLAARLAPWVGWFTCRGGSSPAGLLVL